MTSELLTERIIGAAIAVHRALGPGLLESAYEACLAVEFVACGLAYERQRPVRLSYRNAIVDCAYRIDFLVECTVIVELKAVEKLQEIDTAQMLTYLKLLDLPLGLLINFNSELLKFGIRRVIRAQEHRSPIQSRRAPIANS